MTAEATAVLALNAGSSSIKFAIFGISGATMQAVSHGQVEGIGSAPHFLAKDPAGKVLAERRWDGQSTSHEDLMQALLDWATSHLGHEVLVGVGHRVVHGGSRFHHPEPVTDELLSSLADLTPLAPLHQPHSLAPIRAIASMRPGLPQVACFDTAFHHTMPPVATRFALPRQYEEEGVRRYGFHGLSYEFIAGQLLESAPELAAGRVIVAHLGNGASLCAMHAGRSVDTTMSFTALDGLVMGTRCGTIDPGVVLYLQQAHGMTPAAVEDLLYRRSGLLGVSGISSDMRTLLTNKAQAAAEAIELFVYRIAREAAALAGSLGGLDGLVFTAGIGENTPVVRAAVCQRLAWLGLDLDETANARAANRISAPGSPVDVRVIPTNEEAMIARHTIETIRPACSDPAGSDQKTG